MQLLKSKQLLYQAVGTICCFFALIVCAEVCSAALDREAAANADTGLLAQNEDRRNAVRPDALTDEDLEIVQDQAILCGRSKQMKLKKEASGFFDSVKWSSSDESVISCTKNGVITGKKKGSALITVKASFGKAERSIRVYCAEPFSAGFRVSPKYFNIYILNYYPFIFSVKSFHFMPSISKNISFTVLGYYGSYYYVIHNGTQADGFIHSMFLPPDVGAAEQFKQLSRYGIDIWENVDSTNYVVTTAYSGAVDWRSSDTSVFTYDPATHRLHGNKPGVARLTATAQGKTLTCNVRVLYKWPKSWTGKALKSGSSFYLNGKDGLTAVEEQLSVGDRVTIYGDMGNSDGWAYGSYQPYNRSQPYWGYVKIGDVSTKNTVSFYNSLGWGYPLQNTDYNYLKSPYSPRVIKGERKDHRGFDISTSEVKTQGDISGQTIVAPFDGVVKRVGYDPDSQKGGGNYVCIMSNTVDPVTGKKLIVIIQHMQYYSSVDNGDSVQKGRTVLGFVGATGNAIGAHLHFEVNNWNAAYGESGRSDFTYTINPIYFYMQFPFDKNNDCYATNYGFGHYWYNYDC